MSARKAGLPVSKGPVMSEYVTVSEPGTAPGPEVDQEQRSNKPNLTQRTESAFRDRALSFRGESDEDTKKVMTERKYATAQCPERGAKSQSKAWEPITVSTYSKCSRKLKQPGVRPRKGNNVASGRTRSSNRSAGGINIFANCAYIIHTLK